MTRNGAPHQAALNVMADLYDGRHMWGFTEKDIKNMLVVLIFFPPYLNCNIPVLDFFYITDAFFLKKKACRKAEKVREERDDDLNKLLQFFRECKENNEHFYCDVDANPKSGVVRNIFWSHASQRAVYRDSGDVITFDTMHKTDSRRMPLAMFVGAKKT